MIESLTTLVLLGFSAGFIFAMPIAGPISIIITSNALKGNLKYCVRTALGASIVEFFYVLIVVLGLSALFSLYSPLIPYLLLFGSFFLFFIGVKIVKTNLKIDNINLPSDHEKFDKKGGLRTGIIINFTNPSFFFGILASSFLVLTFASSIGLNTGGLDLLVQENISSFQELTGDELKDIDTTFVIPNHSINEIEHSSDTFLLSLSYAFSLGFGGFLWLVFLAKLLDKYRNKIKVEILTWTIKILGILLCGISLYLMFKSISILFN